MIVVTGGAGFIGSNLVAALEERGLGPIAVVDWFGTGDKWRNLAKRDVAHMVEPERIFDFLDDNIGSIEAIFHLGAISSTTEPDIDLIVRTNITLSTALWNWCSEANVRLIYASSAATYGDGTQGFEDDGSSAALARLRPLNAYGWSKNQFDRHVARAVAAQGDTPPQWAGLKFFNVFGPNEYHKEGQTSVVYQVYQRVRLGGPARLFKSHRQDYADGGQLRDFVWVDDCVAQMLWLFDNSKVSGLFNCGSGKARSFADLATAVFKALGKQPNIEFVPTPENIRDKYQYFTEARMDRIRAAGYARPATPLEDGVTTYVQRYLAADDSYR
jgi:ADP-L-glycero-D-manno-heptose 6-epimerase